MNPRTRLDAEFVISTDANKFALGAVLPQKDMTGKVHPCAFLAQVFQPAHTNYLTYDQKLLGVVCTLKEWRCYIEGSAKITIIGDNATPRHLPTQESLGRRHAIWLSDLSPYLAITPRTHQHIMEILAGQVHQTKETPFPDATNFNTQ
jgi:hypothetical protein